MTIPNQQGNPPNGENSGQDNQQNTNKWMVRFSGLIFAVTCIYSIFSGGQWQSMSNALDETKINRKLEYRAYVGAKGVLLIPRQDNPAWASVVVIAVNTGRTPALNVRMLPGIEHRNSPLSEDVKYNSPEVPNGKSVYLTGVDMSTPIAVIGTGALDNLLATPPKPAEAKGGKPPASATPPPLPSVQAPDIQQSWSGWFAYGMITYEDIFGGHHWTKFCYFNTPRTGNWSSCPTYNETDTDQSETQKKQ